VRRLVAAFNGIRKSGDKSPHSKDAQAENCIDDNSSKNRSISARFNVSGGNNLKTLGSSDCPVMIFFSNNAC